MCQVDALIIQQAAAQAFESECGICEQISLTLFVNGKAVPSSMRLTEYKTRT